MGDEFAERYLSGREIYGDDFSRDEMERWFADEAEGYAGLSELEPGRYGYHALNWRHGFRHLPRRRWRSALAFGAAFGEELMPIIGSVDAVTVVEPSEALRSNRIGPLVPTYVTPSVDGRLPFADGQFDLVTCLGVLHHIPNVSTVAAELLRVTNGWLVVREPVISMGDWRKPRHGVTARERGIPEQQLRSMFSHVSHASRCDFPTTSRLGDLVGRHAFNSRAMTIADDVLSRSFAWNRRYHASSRVGKARPRSLMLVVRHESG